MLPPLDSSVLANNPRFEKLYNTITTSILNLDGSTKIDPSAKQRDAVREELQAYRLKAARVNLLRNAISSAATASSQTVSSQTTIAQPPTQDTDQGHQKQQQSRYQQRRPRPSRQPSQPQQTQQLPPDLIHLLHLLPAFLTNASTLSPQSLSLLLTSPPFTSLTTLFPTILALVSSNLTTAAKSLARILSPNTNPSYIHRIIPSLPTLASTLLTDLQTSKQSLSHARLRTISSLTTYTKKHTQSLHLLIRALEHKHNEIASETASRALQASHTATTWAIASEALLWETRYNVYPPQARDALLHYRQHLLDAGRRLEDGSRVREAELADYGVDVESSSSRRRDSVLLGRGAGSGGDQTRVATTTRRRRGTVDENKERTMREMARVWREMETRLREINGDLSRLR